MMLAPQMMRTTIRGLRPVSACLLLGVVFVFVIGPRPAVAKPVVAVTCDISGDIYLYYNTYNVNEGSWPNYIEYDEYDANGNELTGYPYYDLTPYYTTAVGSPPTTATATESVGTGFTTVVYYITGDWNGCSCTQTTGRTSGSAHGMATTLDWNVRILGKERVVSPTTGQTLPYQFSIYLDAQNLNLTNAADLHFVYCLVKKTDVNQETVTPVIYTDPTSGTPHKFRHVKNATTGTHYAVPAAQAQTVGGVSQTIPGTRTITDLQINLTDSNQTAINVNTDYVWLDVIAVNAKTHTCHSLERIQLLP
jgi:hypothetical protein